MQDPVQKHVSSGDKETHGHGRQEKRHVVLLWIHWLALPWPAFHLLNLKQARLDLFKLRAFFNSFGGRVRAANMCIVALVKQSAMPSRHIEPSRSCGTLSIRNYPPFPVSRWRLEQHATRRMRALRTPRRVRVLGPSCLRQDNLRLRELPKPATGSSRR